MRVRASAEAERAVVLAFWDACELTRAWNPPDGDFDQALVGPSSTVLLAEDDDGSIVGSARSGMTTITAGSTTFPQSLLVNLAVSAGC